MAVELVRAVDELARAQHGLLTTAQAVEALGASRKQRWVAEGRLASVQPGVLRLAGAPETWHQALMAASLAADGVVSHRSAAELWGLIQPAGHIEVSVRPSRHPRLRPPAVAHRILDHHPDLAVARAQLRVTDPVRTIVDLGLVLPRWSVDAALGQGLRTRLLTSPEVRRLREALGRQGRNGTGIIGEVLEERRLNGGGDDDSELEKRLAALVRRYDLPRPVLQQEVWQGGRFVARVDAAYPERRLAIEVDGYEHHPSPAAFQHDRTRQNRLVALGWTVLRFTWTDVVKRPDMVAQTIRAALDRLPAA